MKVVIGGKGSGKTTHLIHESSSTWAPIICFDPEYIKQTAMRKHIEIPEPISYYDAVRPGKLHGQHEVLIDEIDLFLKTIGIFPLEVTLGVEDISAIIFKNGSDGT